MTRRHPDDALVSNPNDTAVPRAQHSATQRMPWSAILKTRRHPDHALLTNPNDTALVSNLQDTAPPRKCAAQQPPHHSAIHATRPPAIPITQRHTRDTPASNPHATAPHTRHAHQQSPWHSATHAACPPAIPTACRCVPRNVRSKLTSTNPRIPCACHDFATPNTRTRARTRDLSHRATKSSDFSYRTRFPAPATQNDAQRGHRSHHSPRLPRETHTACTLPHAGHANPPSRHLPWPPCPTPAT